MKQIYSTLQSNCECIVHLSEEKAGYFPSLVFACILLFHILNLLLSLMGGMSSHPFSLKSSNTNCSAYERLFLPALFFMKAKFGTQLLIEWDCEQSWKQNTRVSRKAQRKQEKFGAFFSSDLAHMFPAWYKVNS